MKKIIRLLMVMSFLSILISPVFSDGSGTIYEEISVEQRKILSSDWYETGKAFLELNKKNDAKACFQYSHNAFPMGEPAYESRKILKNEFKTDIPYNAEMYFNDLISKSDESDNMKIKIHYRLLALEILKNPSKVIQDAGLDESDEVVNYLKQKEIELMIETAGLSLENDDEVLAKKLAESAVEKGADPQEMDENLANLVR